MSLITILTPTYNRADKLASLYESLQKQTDKDFVWRIVDDGSQDNTGDAVQKWSKEASFPIQYIWKENGGKHTALNLGMEKNESLLTFIVDSDDTLTSDAVAAIRKYEDKFHSAYVSGEICGFSFLRMYENGTINEGEFPVNEKIDNYCSQRINAGIAGDKAEVFYTGRLAEYRFKEYPGERFLPEDAVWMLMSADYNMVHINAAIYISEYLEGGLTRTGRKMKINSPLGMMYRSAVYLNSVQLRSLKVKIKMQMLYHIYRTVECRKSRIRRYEAEKLVEIGISHGALYQLTRLPAFCVALAWRYRYK